MSSESLSINKDNLNLYLNEVAKKYKKLSGRKIPAEIILIGGASILVNYGFRDSTTDVDAIIMAASAMKEAIYYVSDKYNLYDGWLNADFERTSSYSTKLIQYSQYYKTFANIVEVRTIKGEYLIAMKLVSGRKYKHDLSDVVGVLKNEEELGNHIDLSIIKKAVEELYGSWEEVSEDSKKFIEDVLNSKDYASLYSKIDKNEETTKEAIIEFRKDNPDKAKGKTANEIIDMINKSRDKDSGLK